MGYSSPLLTPECTPIRPEIVESSTPWPDILLEEWGEQQSNSIHQAQEVDMESGKVALTESVSETSIGYYV
jgi:hypothetical protein